MTKFASSGAFLWTETWGGTGTDYSADIALDGGGNTYVSGAFRGTVDFDPSAGVDDHISNGDYDAFLMKFVP